MILKVDAHSDEPVFRQIVNQVKYAVAHGMYRAGERLPSIRDLAVQKLINPNTVARAFGTLEREGVIVTEHGRGAFVGAKAAGACRDERRRILKNKLRQIISEATNAGLPENDLKKIFHNAMNERKV